MDAAGQNLAVGYTVASHSTETVSVSHDNHGSRHLSRRLRRNATRSIPRLQLDRTGIALLGAIALLATGALRFEEAVAATGARSRARRSEHGSGRMAATRANDRRSHPQRSEGPRTVPHPRAQVGYSCIRPATTPAISSHPL
jgi:hypothetical protein